MKTTNKIELHINWNIWLLGGSWTDETILGKRFRYIAVHLGPLCWLINLAEKSDEATALIKASG